MNVEVEEVLFKVKGWRLRGHSLRFRGRRWRRCSLGLRGWRWRLRGCSLRLSEGGGG